MDSGPYAAIFDLDGVITFTASVHAAAWKELFDGFLKERAEQIGEPFRPFDANTDYHKYVDGKLRYDGVASFLASRNIQIPYGEPSDPPAAITICGLGNRKDQLFREKLEEMDVPVDHEALRFVKDLGGSGWRIGLASSSKNTRPILQKAGIGNLFEAVVDGVVSQRLGLRSKPQPDIFLECLSQLVSPADPRNAAVVEDAISGVQAGRAGGFGLVLGVDRRNTGDMKKNGANLVIHDFTQITVEQFLRYFAKMKRAA